jgi:Ras-related protein Rab-1A
VKLQIWDTAGQEKFRNITSSYYRGAHGIVIVYDITDRNSFVNIKDWLKEIEKFASDSVSRIIIGNKSDLEADRAVSKEEGKELAQGLGVEWIETSAKNSDNVNDAFRIMAQTIQGKVVPNEKGEVKEAPKGEKIAKGNVIKPKKSGCC